MFTADIDVDLPSTFTPEKMFPWTRAAVLRDDRLAPHPCGYYPQRIARDPLTGLAAIPYGPAEELGYFKIDFLHLSVYDKLTSREELEELLKKEPNWKLLLLPSTQEKLFQLAKHGPVINQVKPASIEDVADLMALIRPGKRGLLGVYLKQKEECRRLLYADGEDGYTFKKSHAFAYALVVVLQLHLIEQGKL
jgi:DNA polymerase III alpha subunit